MNADFLRALKFLAENNTIDSGDEEDGSDGGYDAHGNYIIPDAMREIVLLRALATELQDIIEDAALAAVLSQ